MIEFPQLKELKEFLKQDLKDYVNVIKHNNKYCKEDGDSDCFIENTYKIFQESISENVPSYLLIIFTEIGSPYYQSILESSKKFLDGNGFKYSYHITQITWGQYHSCN